MPSFQGIIARFSVFIIESAVMVLERILFDADVDFVDAAANYHITGISSKNLVIVVKTYEVSLHNAILTFFVFHIV